MKRAAALLALAISAQAEAVTTPVGPVEIATLSEQAASFDITVASDASQCARPRQLRVRRDAPNFAISKAAVEAANAGDDAIKAWVSGCDTDGAAIVTNVMVVPR